ncbi:glycoprotein [Achromobacter insolitus]|uniref:hypothetical protein n=1 Tax=Achromobacter insolitus TaxID=217204 RepID=UPI0007C6AF85|nr:hypothetical protein [Achromobacter insolitus]OAE52873.1 glycoprotein [Achromobacter insolitus]OCZ50641.1 glycoprotein [Achromobacter insolitus]
MPKYEVIRPWHGVKAGDVLELSRVHPALKSNVRQLGSEAAELVAATPEASMPRRGRPPKAEDRAE